VNQPPDRFVPVREDRLLAFAAEAFHRAGCDHGDLIARLLVNCDLRGVRSHGTRSAGGYCAGLAEGRYNPTPDVRLVNETASVAVLDGDGALGYLPMTMAADKAVEKARITGVGVGLVRHIGHYGAAGHYTRLCADAGCVGYSVQGYRGEASPKRPPTHAVNHGNPPVSFAFPGRHEPVIVLDGGAAFDSPFPEEGFEQLARAVPAPFFKSLGMLAASTLIGGALTGFLGPEGDAIEARWPGAHQGGTVIALDPAVIADGEAFFAEVDRYVRDIRDGHLPLPGTDRVYLPGHIEAERLATYRRDGIPYGEPEQRSLRQLAERFDLPLPWDEEDGG
jgi:ureidoglycolate dehydrogenase (NAD+)